MLNSAKSLNSAGLSAAGIRLFDEKVFPQVEQARPAVARSWARVLFD